MSAVFITVPKYVAITPSPAALTKIQPAQIRVIHRESPIGTFEGSMDSCSSEESSPRGKKRRLDHLSWEEKIQRKKLKNRVAAQTSRDRKKARMEEMEADIKELTEKTEILQNKCNSLQTINESLLEKNHKLDMEVDVLRKVLAELQERQETEEEERKQQRDTVGTCAGWLNSNGLTVDTRTAEKELNTGSPLEDCCPLPTLQDMLLLDDEFDAGKLEELAESLLADITADMEASDRACNETAPQVTSSSERLLGPVVGTTAERVEPSPYSTTSPGDIGITICHDSTTTDESAGEIKTVALKPPALTLQNQLGVKTEKAPSATKISVPIYPSPDTVYGTYDAKTNSITIVLDDGSGPVNEAVEEIYCDGVAPATTDDVDVQNFIQYPATGVSPSEVYLNVDGCSDDDDDDLNFDPIRTFLRPRRPMLSPLAKSPAPSLHSATSDHGYESIMGSPTPLTGTNSADQEFESSPIEFSWNNSFTELFPSLV